MSSATTDMIEETAHPGRGRDQTGAVQSLTPRQREVLALIGQGLSTAEIARRLYRTVKTIESHRLMLGKRLGARNRVELARIAIQAGLTDLSTGARDAGAGGSAHEEPAATASDPAHRVLAMLDAESSTQHGLSFLQSLVARIVAAFDARAAFILRLGADGAAKSVAGWSERGEACELRYTFASAEDADLAPGEVRVLEGPPAFMLQGADAALFIGVGGSFVASLYGSHGQRLGTLAVFLKTLPDESASATDIVRLLAGRAAAELERKESEDRFNHLQSLVSHSAERIGLWERNLQTNQVTWSTETYRILGFEPNSIVPSREHFMSMIHPEDRDRVKHVSDDVTRSHTPAIIEYRVIRPDGAERRILTCYEAAPDITGRPGWVFGTIKDVTG